MVKKTLLSLAIAATAAGLAGCNISSVQDHDKVDQTAVDAGSGDAQPAVVAPVFNPARSQLPLATDFLLSGTTDGTLVYPDGDVDIFLADGSRNPEYNPVYDAMSDMDGFSTVGQLYIPFSGSLSEGELPAGSVYLVELDYGEAGPKVPDPQINEADPFGGEAAIKAEVVSYADGNLNNSVVRISPTEPLKNNTRYLVVLTNAITDVDGDATVMGSQFKYLIGDDDLLSAALAPVREAVQDWYQLAQGFLASQGASPSSVTTAYTFTTGGTVEVLSAMAAPGNADAALASTVPAVLQHYLNTTEDDAATQSATVGAILSGAGSSATAAEVIGGHALLSTLPAPSPRASNFPALSATVPVDTSMILDGAASSFITGTIDLPYYSQAPSGAYVDDGINLGDDEHYTCSAETASDAATCAAATLSAANTVIGQWATDADVIENLQLAQGADAADAAEVAAPSENVTNLFPFAQENGKVRTQVLVVEPGGSCAKPGSGWPVVMLAHGITGNRMQNIVLAEQLAAAPNCYASVAIDLPMHGLMPTDMITSGVLGGAPFSGAVPLMAAVNQSAGGIAVTDGGATPGTADSFVELDAATQSLIISGQTVSQRHFGLTADASGALPEAVDGDIDGGEGTAADQSGSLYIDFLHFQTTRDNNRQAVMDLLNLNATIPFMDIDGDGNGGPANTDPDFDASRIYFAGISLGSIIGTQFVAVNNTSAVPANPAGNPALNRVQAAVFSVPGGGLPKLLENSATFGPTIVGALENPDSFNLTQGGSSYESLMYVYQATVDSADPMNFGGLMQLSQTPYTLIESVGDTVIPNSVADAPLAGTDPLISVFAAEQVESGSTIGAGDQVFVKLSDDLSSHSSFAVPDTDANTPETAATFGVLVQHAISRFNGSPALNDGGAGIIEAIPAE